MLEECEEKLPATSLLLHDIDLLEDNIDEEMRDLKLEETENLWPLLEEPA